MGKKRTRTLLPQQRYERRGRLNWEKVQEWKKKHSVLNFNRHKVIKEITFKVCWAFFFFVFLCGGWNYLVCGLTGSHFLAGMSRTRNSQSHTASEEHRAKRGAPISEACLIQPQRSSLPSFLCLRRDTTAVTQTGILPTAQSCSNSHHSQAGLPEEVERGKRKEKEENRTSKSEFLDCTSKSHYRLLPVVTWDCLCCMLRIWEVMPFQSCSIWSASLWDCSSTQLLRIYKEAGHATGVETNKGRGPNAVNFILISETRVFVPLFSHTDSFLNNAGQHDDFFLNTQPNISTQNYKNYNFSCLLLVTDQDGKKCLISKPTSNRIHIDKAQANYFIYFILSKKCVFGLYKCEESSSPTKMPLQSFFLSFSLCFPLDSRNSSC